MDSHSFLLGGWGGGLYRSPMDKPPPCLQGGTSYILFSLPPPIEPARRLSAPCCFPGRYDNPVIGCNLCWSL